MADWLINGVTPASLNLRIVGGVFNSGGASSVELEAIRACDASQILAYNQVVEITRDNAPFFKGKVKRVPRICPAGSAESQIYLIQDGFEELETTTYQEPWNIGGVAVYMPLVYLGVSSSGSRINLGQQIGEVITYAASVGVPLAVGSVPTGMLLWPTEANTQSCAQIIRDSLRYHPDWIPWVNHDTSTPTFNVTPRSSATARTISIVGNAGFDITEETATLPECVRIVFLTTGTNGEEPVRSIGIDKYPVSGADGGPGVLNTVVDLAGANQSIQKQQIVARTIPDIGDEAAAKTYLKKKFPALDTVADTSWSVETWSKAFVPETEDEADEPPPINPNATRIKGTNLAGLPRELVDGNIAEWMRRKVGWVHCSVELETSGASEAELKILSNIPREFTVRATNAVSKIYRGLSSFTPAESRPTGIAQAYYETIQGGCRYSGSITIVESDVGATRYHGCKLNLSGGDSAWASMGAPIHTVAWDLQSRMVTLSFGPNPNYSVQDFLEYLKLLNKRPAQWISSSERTSADVGDDTGPSARKDIVGPRDGPETIYGGGSASAPSCNNLRIFLDPESGETPAYLISAGQIGDKIIAEQSVSGSQIFAKITLTPSDGTYTATIESSCTASDTVTCVLLGSIADDVITQHTCGPILVETCRDWFVSPAKYSLSAS